MEGRDDSVFHLHFMLYHSAKTTSKRTEINIPIC